MKAAQGLRFSCVTMHTAFHCSTDSGLRAPSASLAALVLMEVIYSSRRGSSLCAHAGYFLSSSESSPTLGREASLRHQAEVWRTCLVSVRVSASGPLPILLLALLRRGEQLQEILHALNPASVWGVLSSKERKNRVCLHSECVCVCVRMCIFDRLCINSHKHQRFFLICPPPSVIPTNPPLTSFCHFPFLLAFSFFSASLSVFVRLTSPALAWRSVTALRSHQRGK